MKLRFFVALNGWSNLKFKNHDSVKDGVLLGFEANLIV